MAAEPTPTDELSKPLGQTAKPKRRLTLPPSAIPIALAGGLGAALLVFVGWIAVVDDPLGGEPVAIISTKPVAQPRAATPAGRAATPETPAGGSQQAAGAAPAPQPGTQTVTIIDGSSGQRQQVTVAAPPPSQTAQIDERLIEVTRHGTLPRIGANGLRPADAYSSRDGAEVSHNGPRIAIVVGRLGVSASGTGEALARLPAKVSLGFVPYGTDLERWVTRARSEGREILLQVPMEPFEFPDNDAGPQTLMTSLTPAQNIERLHWAMSRFQGYVGIANYMGARFSSNDPGMRTVLDEAGKRGLIYFDDGTAARSLAAQIAAGGGVPLVRTDIVIDAAPTANEIDAALARLEGVARERGIAVGSASALPVSIDRILRWAKAAEARGVLLVPITAAVSKPKSS
jgi:polysaccharide deacetylase 2 family uncharacterized protein YibQ